MKFVFGPDVILCGWLGSNHQLTNWLLFSFLFFLFLIFFSALLFFITPQSVTIFLLPQLLLQFLSPFLFALFLFCCCFKIVFLLVLLDFLFLLISQALSRLPPPQWGAADAEISLIRWERSLNVLPLKPGVGQHIASHATPAAGDFFLAYFYPFGLLLREFVRLPAPHEIPYRTPMFASRHWHDFLGYAALKWQTYLQTFS